MTHTELIPLFSKPVFKTNIKDITVDFSKIKWARNYNNWISEDQNILSRPEFESLFKSVAPVITEYFYGVMGVMPQTEMFVTESWLNKTEKGQTHHRHWHPNSVLSGVVYLDTDGVSGPIKFITSNYDLLEFEISQPNLYNSKSWSITPMPGDVIIFPSNVEHMVEEYQGENPRISLAFNTFVKGNINNLPLIKLSI